MPDELDREHQPVAPPPGGGETPAPLAGHSPGRGAEHGLRAGAGRAALPARATRPDHATRFLETTRGVLSYSEVAPLLAERVLRLETALYQPEFASWPPDERLAENDAVRGARTFLSAPARHATPKRTGMSALQTNARRARTKLSACHRTGWGLQPLRQDWKVSWARGELLRAYRGEIGRDAGTGYGELAIAVHALAECR